ncbi:hypothetical protein a10_07143 [Streptomyces acidiscabies]|nr:hypothetical protein a10_07143 [Streptomyces acidiscabies]GAV43814.1 hypothetical protein Saa2_06772 [Streptomyces acidiscabies]
MKGPFGVLCDGMSFSGAGSVRDGVGAPEKRSSAT